VFITDIERGIPVRIGPMTTRTTEKLGLTRPIATADVAAGSTPLARMPWVDPDDTATQSLSLVVQERAQLSERPGVQTPFGFAPCCLYPRPDVRQVLHYDSCSRRDAAQDAFAQHMITVPPEALLAPRKESQVPLGTLGSFGLEIPFEAETPFADFAPAFLTMQSAIGGNGGARHAQVNADDRALIGKLNVVQFQDDVQGEPPLAIHEVGSGGAFADQCQCVVWDGEGDLLTPLDGGEVGQPLLPIHRERVAVVAGRAERGLWGADFSAFPNKSHRGLDGFRRLLPRLDVQIGHEFRAECFAAPIGNFVQGVSVALFQTPSRTANSIERLRELTHRFQQDFGLLRCGF